jgi:hypothetical protein
MLKLIFQALFLHSRLFERRLPVTKEQKNLLHKTQELLLHSSSAACLLPKQNLKSQRFFSTFPI